MGPGLPWRHRKWLLYLNLTAMDINPKKMTYFWRNPALGFLKRVAVFDEAYFKELLVFFSIIFSRVQPLRKRVPSWRARFYPGEPGPTLTSPSPGYIYKLHFIFVLVCISPLPLLIRICSPKLLCRQNLRPPTFWFL